MNDPPPILAATRPPLAPASGPAVLGEPGPPVLPASGPSVPPASEPPVLARPPPPRIWPSLLVLFGAPIAGFLLSGIVIVAAAVLDGALRSGVDPKDALTGWLEANLTTPAGILAALLPGQLVFLAAALLPAFASREPRRRLGLVPFDNPVTTLALTLAGTLFVQQLCSIVADQWIEEPSDSLKMIWRMIAEPQGALAVAVVILFSVVPGFCEEVVMRGYVQTRLLQRWPPILAIGLTSFVFAAAHADVQHSLAVFPLGVWLGFVAWRTGSVWVPILCHFFNNFTAVVVGRWLGDEETGSLPDGPIYFGIFGALFIVWTLAMFDLLRRAPGRR